MDRIIRYFKNVILGGTIIFRNLKQTLSDICHAFGPDKELRQEGRQALKVTAKQVIRDSIYGFKQGWNDVFGKK